MVMQEVGEQSGGAQQEVSTRAAGDREILWGVLEGFQLPEQPGAEELGRAEISPGRYALTMLPV